MAQRAVVWHGAMQRAMELAELAREVIADSRNHRHLSALRRAWRHPPTAPADDQEARRDTRPPSRT
ncbi:MAG: hypothetical protein FJ027_04470 [Candidatus Rokubacteria bacterium]|nr:hypothetical protein [Candidatus Rokubacteria bacterium]